MERKFTQGEWLVNPRASRNVKCNGVTIANCSSGQSGDSEEEEIANTKLISAAPELLEALKICYASLSTYGSHPIIEKQVENALKKALT